MDKGGVYARSPYIGHFPVRSGETEMRLNSQGECNSPCETRSVYKPAARTAEMTMLPLISDTGAPREQSHTIFRNPCSMGP